MASLQLIGLETLDAKLAKLAKLPNTKEAKDVFVKAAHPVVKWAKYFAPFDPGRKKETHLRDAIVINKGPLAFSNVLVLPSQKRRGGAPHAHLLEFGTVKMAPRPFMRPAAMTARAEVLEILKRELPELFKNAI